MTTIPQRDRYIGDETQSQFWWFVNGALINLSSGYTFSATLKRADTPATTIFTKTTGFTGATGSGNESEGVANLVVTWATTGEMNLPTEGLHRFVIVATKTADSSQETLEVLYSMRSR